MTLVPEHPCNGTSLHLYGVDLFAAVSAPTLLERIPLDVPLVLLGDLCPFGHKGIGEVGH